MAAGNDRVVVGYDASQESLVALEWAAIVAQRRRASLLVVHATGAERSGLAPARFSAARRDQRDAQAVAEEGAERAREYADIDVEARGVQRGAAAALQELSGEAALIVVGHRGHGKLRGALVGSVAYAVATHAECPVAVVRHSLRPLPSQEYPIVVGVDGSEYSRAALDEAARLAVDTGSFLRIVVAWRRLPVDVRGIAYEPRGDAPGRLESDPWQYGTEPSLLDQVAAEYAQHGRDVAAQSARWVQERHP
ncbi:MAG TPA: universal stress protein, partial [Brevibacterium sp.]|nr:universal stress protein [Brevibacterium sp.]